MIRENPGVGLPDSVRMVEAALLSHHLLPACKLCWSPSTWWLQRASIGLGPGRVELVLEAGEHTTGQETTPMWTMATGQMGILCQVWSTLQTIYFQGDSHFHYQDLHLLQLILPLILWKAKFGHQTILTRMMETIIR